MIYFEFHINSLCIVIVTTVVAPNFKALLEYTQILSETAVSLDFFCFDTTERINESEAEIEKRINELIKLEDYNNALRLTKSANFSASKIILAEVSFFPFFLYFNILPLHICVFLIFSIVVNIKKTLTKMVWLILGFGVVVLQILKNLTFAMKKLQNSL